MRPIICRSHGLPVRLDDGDDVCPLNFSGGDLSDVPVDDILALSTTNMILSAVDQLYVQQTGASSDREALSSVRARTSPYV